LPLAVFGMWAPILLMAFVSTLYAPSFSEAVRLALVFLSYWAFFSFPFFMLRSSADLTRFVLVIFASSIIPSLYALWEIRHGLGDMEDFRAQSTFAHPNIFAFYLVLLLGLALYIRTSNAVRVGRRLRTLITLYVPVLLFFLMMTKTRSAWMTCALMFSIYAIWFDRRFLLGLLFVPVIFVVDPSLTDRLTDLTKGQTIESFDQLNESTRLNSYVWRKALWEAAIPLIELKPLLGYGLESFKPSTPEFFALIGPEGIDAHNFYLQITFEMGLLGLFGLVWLFLVLLRFIVRGFRYDSQGITVIVGIVLSYLLQSYVDNMHFYLSFNWYFWFVMGTICAWVEHMRTDQNTAESGRPRRAARQATAWSLPPRR
jgi:O-antigen ligase